MNEWRVFVDAGRPTLEQMAYDEQLAREALPTVRFFLWQPPAISLGWKQSPPEWLRAPAWQATKLAWVERPSGGGIAFHGSDVSIAIVIPRILDQSLDALMRAVCDSAVKLCGRYGIHAEGVLDVKGQARVTYCLTEVSSYAVLIDGRKIAGFSLRRYPKSWLIQGSLLVQPLPDALRQGLPQPLQQELHTRALSLSEVLGEPMSEHGVASKWSEHWAAWWNGSSRATNHWSLATNTNALFPDAPH